MSLSRAVLLGGFSKAAMSQVTCDDLRNAMIPAAIFGLKSLCALLALSGQLPYVSDGDGSRLPKGI